MDQFISLLPEGKAVSCIEDFSILTVKELKKILLAYKEKVSGAKADLILRAYAVFSRLEQQENSAVSTSEPVLVGEDAECTYNAIFSSKCSHLLWSSDLRGTPGYSFIQLYSYLVVRTMKFKHIKLKSTAYKKLKAFQFFFKATLSISQLQGIIISLFLMSA